MMGTRRGWAGALALVLCVTMIGTGCSTAWIGQAEEIVGVLIPAASNLVALVAALEGKGVSAADLQMIQKAGSQAGADLQLIESLIAAYQKADATAQPGILNQIESTIGAVQGNLQGLLPALHIEDTTTQAKVTAVIGILLSEVQSLAAIVPVLKQGPGGQGAVKAQISGAAGRHPKAPLSAQEFVASYNATMAAKTGNAALDQAAAGLVIHEHGKAARVVSGGWLK